MATVESLINELRRLRFEHGHISQAALAKAVNVSRQTINAIETGRYLPSILLAIRIARYFQLPVETVFRMEADDEG